MQQVYYSTINLFCQPLFYYCYGMDGMFFIRTKARKNGILEHQSATYREFSETAAYAVGCFFKHVEAGAADGLAIEDRDLLVSLGAKIRAANAEASDRGEGIFSFVECRRGAVYLALG